MPAELAKGNPVKIVWYVIHTLSVCDVVCHVTCPICAYRNFDEAGILACDGGKFLEKEVFIVYEDRNEHLHAETAKKGQLPMRLKINAAAEQVRMYVCLYLYEI